MNTESASEKPSIVRRIVLGIFVVLLACAVIGAAAVLLRYNSARRINFVTLPDGRVMEFLVCTQGGKPPLVDKPWQRTARRLLPTRFQKWLPPVMSGYTGSSNQVIAYFRMPSSPTGAQPWNNYQTEDDTGFRYPLDGGSSSFGSSTPGETIVGLSLRSYPRRQKTFLFRLINSSGTDIATFRIPSPDLGPFPQWQSSPLPQTKTNGPVTLTLQGLTRRGTGPQFYTSPAWQLESSDPAWKNARTRYMNVLDPTGNEGSFLSPQESVWKVRTTVFRDRPQDFASNELVTLTNLPVQSPGMFLPLDLTNNCNGVTIIVQLFAGPGRLDIINSNGISRTMVTTPSFGHGTSSYGNGVTIDSLGSATPFLLVEAKNVQDRDEIQFRWTDDQSREIKPVTGGPSYYGSASGSRMYQIRPSLTNAVKSLNVTITVNRPLVFEFLINPADIQPGRQ